MEVAMTLILLTACSLVLVIFLRNVLCGSVSYWKSRGVPCVPGALPIFGNTLTILKLKDNLATWSRPVYLENRRSASMIGFFNMSKPTLMLLDPDLVKIVLQTSFKQFEVNEVTVDRKLDPLISGEIFFLRGQEWKDARAVFVSTLSIKRVKLMSETIERSCEKMRKYLKSLIADKQTKGGEDSFEVEAKDLFSRYTSEVAAGTIFSIDGHSFEKDTTDSLVSSLNTIFKPSTNQALMFLSLSSFISKLMQRSFVPPQVDAYFRRVTKDVEELKSRQGSGSNDVLRIMLDLVKEQKISRDEALSHTFAFLIESYETSSLTLSFAAYALAKNPEIQETARREIQSVLAKHDGRVTYEAIQELNFTERVINETLRLFPPGGYMLKVAKERFRLEGADGLNTVVEPGTSVMIPIMGLHEDDQIWENPHIFDPDRFTRENTERRHKFAYLPFSEGPRACPGLRLALTQIKAAIATVLRDYTVQLSPKMIDPLRIDPTYMLNTALGGVMIKLSSLKNHEDITDST